MVRRESRYLASFERRFDLPNAVDGDKIEASFKNGVLTVTLPKKPEAVKAQRKIAIQAG
jgi:HSP20 family protein